MTSWGVGDWNEGASKTEVSGSSNGDGNATFQPAAHVEIWTCPFFGKEGGHAFHEHIGFPAYYNQT